MHKSGKQESLHQTFGGKYIKAVVYGANDGIITTFAVVSGVAGADLSITTVLILGFANLIADGISMGASDYLGSKSEADYYKREKKMEQWEIKNIPDEEREEIRQIYAKKGLEGKDLERVVEVITSDDKRWVDVMMKEELGLVEEPVSDARKSGLVTFASFVVAGFMPLASYVFFAQTTDPFRLSVLITGVTLFAVGATRTLVTKRSWWRAGIEMFAVGMAAAIAAYFIGWFVKGIVG